MTLNRIPIWLDRYASQKRDNTNKSEGLMRTFKECKITEKQLHGCLKRYMRFLSKFFIRVTCRIFVDEEAVKIPAIHLK